MAKCRWLQRLCVYVKLQTVFVLGNLPFLYFTIQFRSIAFDSDWNLAMQQLSALTVSVKSENEKTVVRIVFNYKICFLSIFDIKRVANI